MPDRAKEIGERLGERLAELGLSPEALAGRVGKGKSIIRKYIRGVSIPQKRKVMAPIADALGVNLAWLYDGEGPKFPAAGEFPPVSRSETGPDGAFPAQPGAGVSDWCRAVEARMVAVEARVGRLERCKCTCGARD